MNQACNWKRKEKKKSKSSNDFRKTGRNNEKGEIRKIKKSLDLRNGCCTPPNPSGPLKIQGSNACYRLTDESITLCQRKLPRISWCPFIKGSPHPVTGQCKALKAQFPCPNLAHLWKASMPPHGISWGC